MDKYKFTIMVLSLSLFLAPRTQAQLKAQSGARKTNIPTITVTKLDISDKTLKMSYEIRNDSDEDIWICDDINMGGMTHAEVYLFEDSQTLMIRRRLGVIQYTFTNQAIGRYVRLPMNGSMPESLLIPLPVHQKSLFSGRGRTQGIVYADCLILEIGYYTEDLPGMIRSILEKSEKITDKITDKELARIKEHMGGLLFFNELNEGLSQRDEQVLVPYTSRALKGEHVLSTKIEDQRIPYIGRERYPGFLPPDLNLCTRVEIRYQPSMLEYFFPYDNQQGLLSTDEKKYLQSERLIVLDVSENLKALASEVSNQINSIGGIVCERSNAKVVCYRDDERLTSLNVYDDTTIETEQKERIKYQRILQSLRKLTPNIQPLELRMQCAANLKNLWYRYRLYQNVTKSRRTGLFRKRKRPYPAPNEWCDAIVQAFWRTSDKSVMRPFKCLSEGEGKCHYSMNTNCKADSPEDVVLLFETKAGWNQHGGPELFTFDNHEPKGGCVVLNDGNVKFIRTREELQQLRWK